MEMKSGEPVQIAAGLYAHWAAFADLSPHDVHDLLQLRQSVFVIEQDCLYPDIDGKDPTALHLLARTDDGAALAGALRLFLADVDGGEARIGRIVVEKTFRGTGLGRKLLSAGIEKARSAVPGCAIVLSAQAHLEVFYKSLGFQAESEIYLEDGIPHIDMALRVSDEGASG